MKFLLYGASGHGLVVADIIVAAGLGKALMFIDDDPAKNRYKHLPVVRLPSLPKSILQDPRVRAIVTIGINSIRLEKASEMRRLGFKIGTAIHPTAAVDPSAEIGEGTVLMAQTAVNAFSRIGRDVIINTGATVDHECALDDGVHISPGAHLAGNVMVGARAHIGIAASVIQGVKIGTDAVIGAGAVVIRNVPPGSTVVGNPAKPIAKARPLRR